MDVIAWFVAGCSLVVGAVLAARLTSLVVRTRFAVDLATASAERDLLRERVVDLEAAVSEDSETAQVLGPLRTSLEQVARQVHDLERERVRQFAQVSSELTQVHASTSDLRAQTASLVGSLNASSVRGSWGEVQLRRVLEHAGMLARCDFDEQVSATASDGRAVRPDVVVHLPGAKQLVIDAKAPMTSFLAAQADDLPPADRERLLRAHARSLRTYVDALAGKAYWSALPVSPEMVVCFVPGEAFLTAALATDPGLHEHAMRQRVVLASPATLLALLRTVAFTWQQDALTEGARELLDIGRELYERLGGLGQHASRMGAALQRSVEAYNGFIGSLESRVLVTARRMQEIGVVGHRLPNLAPMTTAGRPLTAVELLESLEPDVGRPQLDLPQFDLPRGHRTGEERDATGQTG